MGELSDPKGQKAELTGREKEAYVAGLFGEIAAPYDRLNRAISLGRDRAWRRQVVELALVGPGSWVADLGTGTGDLAFDLAAAVQPGGRVIASDLTPAMLSVAEQKLSQTSVPGLSFHHANAANTGLQASTCDAVTMGWVLRNVGERPPVYAEVLRILKPGGRFVCIDMSRPEGWFARTGFWFYRHLFMPMMARLLGGNLSAYRYLAHSTDRFPDAAALEAELRTAGFTSVRSLPLMLGSLRIHCGCRP